MANYEDAGVFSDAVEEVVSNIGLASGSAVSDGIEASIMAAVSGAIAGGAGVAATVVSTPDDWAAAAAKSAAIIMEGAPVEKPVGAEDAVRMIVTAPGVGGNDVNMTAINDDVSVVLSGGMKDTVATGGGDDTVVFNGGEATIGTGAGDDTVVLSHGGGSGADVALGTGSDEVIIADIDGGKATVDGGDGFDRVTFSGQSMADAKASFGKPGSDGFHLSAGGGNLTLENVEIVGFDANSDGVLDDATVLATSKGESLVARLYTVALGRSVLDGDSSTVADTQLSGIQWWIDNFGDNADLATIASTFIGCQEFLDDVAGMNTLQIINKMMGNVGITNAGAITADELALQVDTGAMTLGDAAQTIAMSLETTNVIGLLGDQYVIDDFSA